MRRFVGRLGSVVLISSLFSLSQSTKLQLPPRVTAGSSFNIATTGRGSATFYFIGPARLIKRSAELGQDLAVSGDDINASGAYQAIVCTSDGCVSSALHVKPAAASKLIFLLHPSRVPVSTPNAVNGTAVVADKFHNTVITSANVDFHLSLAGQGESTRSVRTVRGIAWFEMGSNSKQGALQVTAFLGDTAEPRVIQQVASEACGLRMNASTVDRSVTLQTDPIRDCAGNPLPDGTIVSFTKTDAAGRSTVDTPIKKDTASAKFDVTGPAHISVACGVVLGNEISLGGRHE